jgi:folate-binding protein YgfZ
LESNTIFGFLAISGPDAKKFLQGQLTCNLDEISATQGLYGAQCNPQGRVLCFFQMIWANDMALLQMPRDTIFATMLALKKYAVFFKVTLQDYSDITQAIFVSQARDNFPVDQLAVVNHDDYIVIKWLDDLYEIIAPQHTLNHLADTPLSDNAVRCLLLQNGIPLIDSVNSGKYLPHELNLQRIQAISFTKGCYTGQEIIARMHYRGQLKKQLFAARLKTSKIPEINADLYHMGTVCGAIVCAVQQSPAVYLILVLCHIDAHANPPVCLADETELQFLHIPYVLER